MLHGPFVHVGETVTDLQFLGCELHQNAYGGRVPRGPLGAIAVALPRHLAIIKGEGGMGKERVGNREGVGIGTRDRWAR